MTPEHWLKLVINAKLEAGLLKPHNYAIRSSKQRILKPLSTIRPAFRTIARSLKDVDLVLVEESFERMLLSYDRVFTSMSMPACLCRRTGEIYRANKEFASLVDCTVDDLRDGKLAIYELMTEESAVNFWGKIRVHSV
ncbi:CRB_1a_G0054630.mRNA.1.CDS.1 [Saccharomyces cerevisiae]|nr:CRB_1a_G0054630.mRNA.1.CDS.1 [Saccharomyces cerevisiae]CAI7479427.1 CRB_1a_G0054630.mRNA.1.CDS.1 [Saccharomyces cerevisiae]